MTSKIFQPLQGGLKLYKRIKIQSIGKLMPNGEPARGRSHFKEFDGNTDIPFEGYEEERTKTAFVDTLSDEQLKELNAILRWNCFTVDSSGRRFGRVANPNKRIKAQEVPDRRILMMNDEFDLSNKSVLEVGCFEGVHTVGLCKIAKSVTAIDSRVENVVKTMVRTAFFNCHPQVFLCDLEKTKEALKPQLRADLVHHVGVLYHLTDPVQHLLELGQHINTGIMLDTHYASEEKAKLSYSSGGKTFRYYRHAESGYSDVFSGMGNHAKWLTLEDLTKTLSMAGFKNIRVAEDRAERNGPRTLIFAKK